MSRFILGISAAVMGLMMLAGCNGGNEESLGPVETVEEFCRAVTSGNWDEAEALCDTLSMREYIDSHKEAWATLQQEDSCVMAIAETLLAGTVITVTEVKREDDERAVSYTLTADGNSKTRKAILKKEEGAWRVVRITDAN